MASPATVFILNYKDTSKTYQKKLCPTRCTGAPVSTLRLFIRSREAAANSTVLRSRIARVTCEWLCCSGSVFVQQPLHGTASFCHTSYGSSTGSGETSPVHASTQNGSQEVAHMQHGALVVRHGISGCMQSSVLETRRPCTTLGLEHRPVPGGETPSSRLPTACAGTRGA